MTQDWRGANDFFGDSGGTKAPTPNRAPSGAGPKPRQMAPLNSKADAFDRVEWLGDWT